MTEPWQCPSCGVEHRCGDGPPTFCGPPVVRDMPPARSEKTTPANITVNVTGSVLSERDLLRAVQRATRWGR